MRRIHVAVPARVKNPKIKKKEQYCLLREILIVLHPNQHRYMTVDEILDAINARRVHPNHGLHNTKLTKQHIKTLSKEALNNFGIMIVTSTDGFKIANSSSDIDTFVSIEELRIKGSQRNIDSANHLRDVPVNAAIKNGMAKARQYYGV